MVFVRDRLKSYELKFREISNTLTVNLLDYEALIGIRTQLNFLYRDISDELTAIVNTNKIYYEQVKTSRRADAINALLGSEEAEKFKAKSVSAIEKIIGVNEGYAQYASEYAMAYGSYKNLGTLLESIRLTTDTLASRMRYELTVNQKDVK